MSHAPQAAQDGEATDGRAPMRVAAAESPGLRALLALQVAVVVVVALKFAAAVLIPLTMAMLLAFVLAPLTQLLRRVRIGRGPGALLSVTLALGLIAGLLWLIGTQMVSLGTELTAHQATIERKLGLLRDVGGSEWRLADRLREQVGHLSHSVVAPTADHAPARSDSPAAAATRPQAPEPARSPGPDNMTLLRTVAGMVLSPLAEAAIVLVVTMFILLQREDLRDRMIRLFGARDLHKTTRAINEAATRLSRYFVTQLAINAGFGCVIATGLFLIGVPGPLLWGILAALLRFVPYFGSILSALFPLLLSIAIAPGWSQAIETGLLFLVVETLVGQAVEPIVIGRRTGLSPVAVVVAATFWTWIWGPLGLVLSTPLTLCFVALGRHVDRLEFLAVLFGDRPALSPIESFYQRMLAGDPDEAAEQAERLLQERSLSSYYDEVLIPGLRMADADARRGVLDESQRGRMLGAVADLLEELDGHDDADFDAPPPVAGDSADEREEGKIDGLPRWPAPVGYLLQSEATRQAWRSGAPVLCIPGAGAVDEAGCLVLEQIFSKHGIGVRRLGLESVSRLRIGELDREGVAVICLCVMEAGMQASHLRYTCRRIRRHAPGIELMIVFWPHPDNEGESRLREVVGADLFAVTVREAVTVCLASARGEGNPG